MHVHCSTPILSRPHLAASIIYVGREYKINVSACERYTINVGSLQSRMHKSCWTDLVCCFRRSGRCISWTRTYNFKSFWAVFDKLPRRFSLFYLPFGSRSKHRNRCNNHLTSESLTCQDRFWTPHIIHICYSCFIGPFGDACTRIVDATFTSSPRGAERFCYA